MTGGHLNRIFLAVLTIVFIGVIACSSENGEVAPDSESHPASTVPATESKEPTGSIQSPYQGQETRKIKALSQSDIEGLLNGSGTPFGGMAKPAELNGYPGPRHVLDAVAAGEFQVTEVQLAQIEPLYQKMRSEAVALGQAIIDAEQSVDSGFLNSTVTEESLKDKIAESAQLYGQLRLVHLRTHLSMLDILEPEQVTKYNLLRGYTSGDDPCANTPAGHDASLWKMHNNCP